MERCEECGFVYAELGSSAVSGALRSYPELYGEVVGRAVERGAVRVRPRPETWSVLEYACHVRDVLHVQRERLQLALERDRPTFSPMGRDERAVEERYNEQDPRVVLDELGAAAGRLSAAFDALDADGWQRTGIYNWPEPAERTMLWLGRHTVHEVIHHLGDIQRGLEEVAVPSLDGRRFASSEQVAGGEVGSDTVFDYHQDGDLVWASYEGGAIRRGYLVGIRRGDRLEFRYVQINRDGQSASGHCCSDLSLTADGRIRMDETWRWESREGSGTSTVEELR